MMVFDRLERDMAPYSLCNKKMCPVAQKMVCYGEEGL